jgi:cupin 2 domain-containing protein
MELGNIFESIPKNLDEEIFENLLQSKDIRIERIISKGHSSPVSGWYDQELNEWVIILKGGAIISFETVKEIILGVGDYINIPAHAKHKVSWTNPEMETIWLAIHYK